MSTKLTAGIVCFRRRVCRDLCDFNTGQSLDGHYDFADLLIRFKIPVCFDDIEEREGAIDPGLEPALREVVGDEFLGRGAQDPVVHELVECVTAHGHSLLKRRKKWEGRGLAA